MSFELPVLLECKEALQLQGSDSTDRFTLARPDCHNLCAHLVLIALFRLHGQILFQLLNLRLLERKHGCASAALSINSLGLLD